MIFNLFFHFAEMSFRNFIYTEEDEDLTFLPKDLFPGFNIGSPSVSINTKPIRTDEEPAKLASGSSTSCTFRAKASAMKDDTPMLSISDDNEASLCIDGQ
ncbi:hypothetical protein Tco_1354692 [Tanacetum coccineum]